MSEKVPEEIKDFVQQTGCLIGFIITDSVIGLGTFFLNGISFSFYKEKISSNINHLLYFILSLFGLATSLGAALHVVILGFTLSYTEGVLKVFLPISYVIMMTSTYVTAMISVLLAVVRTINIVTPFKKISRVSILVVIGLYLLVVVGVVTVDVYFFKSSAFDKGDKAFGSDDSRVGNEYYFNFINVSGMFGFLGTLVAHDLVHPTILEHHQKLWPFFIWFIPFVIPSLICLICSIIQIYSLRGKKRVKGNDHTNSKVTVTILLLTTTFFVCNTMSFTFCITMVFRSLVGVQYVMLLYVLTSIVPILNTFLNPVILISRGHVLREYFIKVVTCRRCAGNQEMDQVFVLSEMHGQDAQPITKQETLESFTHYKG